MAKVWNLNQWYDGPPLPTQVYGMDQVTVPDGWEIYKYGIPTETEVPLPVQTDYSTDIAKTRPHRLIIRRSV